MPVTTIRVFLKFFGSRRMFRIMTGRFQMSVTLIITKLVIFCEIGEVGMGEMCGLERGGGSGGGNEKTRCPSRRARF